MPKWKTRDAPCGKRCLGDYIKTKDTHRRRGEKYTHVVQKQTKQTTYPNGINHTFGLYEKKNTKLSAIPNDERDFFRGWVESRHLESQYLILALTYWMRIRSEIAVFFLVREKKLYMILCIHTALKWLGYDEVYKCNFIQDLREVAGISSQEHAELEIDVLRSLSWEL